MKNYIQKKQNEYIIEILKHDKPWDWSGLSHNLNFLKLPDDFKTKHIKEFIAINKIKRAWRLCNSDPNYLVCRKRLLQEYGELH